MTERTVFIDGLLADVFLSCKVNAMRSVHSLRIMSLLSYPSWWVEGILIIGVRPGPAPRNDYFRETDNQILLQIYMLNGTSNEEKYR